jgi:hypothetical protein
LAVRWNTAEITLRIDSPDQGWAKVVLSENSWMAGHPYAIRSARRSGPIDHFPIANGLDRNPGESPSPSQIENAFAFASLTLSLTGGSRLYHANTNKGTHPLFQDF